MGLFDIVQRFMLYTNPCCLWCRWPTLCRNGSRSLFYFWEKNTFAGLVCSGIGGLLCSGITGLLYSGMSGLL